MAFVDSNIDLSNSHSNSNIYVTEPNLPDLERLLNHMKVIWKSKRLTNNGPYCIEFEKELSIIGNCKYVAATSSGTTALETAVRALDLKGEVITTPYSFIASASCLAINNIKPDFVDIDPSNLNIDPKKIEEKISKKTSAILGVHVYGRSCNTQDIKIIADRHNLKVIYDGSHCMHPYNQNSGSIFKNGDITTTSFHATKVLNTLEGGALFTDSKAILERVKRLINLDSHPKKKLKISPPMES